MNIKLLNLARSGNGVRRYHTVTNPGVTETVGHHTAGVIGILFCLYDQNPPLKLIEAALYHDIPEYITGDIPATAKWDFEGLDKSSEIAENEVMEAVGYRADLDFEQLAMLKFADIMDLIFKCRAEHMCGNSEMKVIYDRGVQFAKQWVDRHLSKNLNAVDFLNLYCKENFIYGEAGRR